MNIGERYRRFHQQADIALLRQLAGVDDVRQGSAEADVRREYEEGEMASALWELQVEDERNGGIVRRK